MDLITTKDKDFVAFLAELDELLEVIEEVVDNCKPALGGERFLTDTEVSKLLKVSRRTLQDYRTQGKIAFIHLGGKVLYRESDIEEMLQENYCKAWQ
ncbi:helix-turn-helix domain-containing protein [Dysgonomonas sp.]